MGITVHLHRAFQQYCGNLNTIEAKGPTVKDCLDYIIRMYPELKKAIFLENDKLHPLIEIYVNSMSTYPDALKKQVKEGDKIHIIHTLAGG